MIYKNKIFIACPISKYLIGNGMEPNMEEFMKSIYKLCNRYSSNVFMALFREDYGKSRMEDHICTPLDYKEMKDADIVIAIPENSQGVAVEVGWASAMNKKIMLILNDKETTSPLINALGTVTDVHLYKDVFDDGYTEAKNDILIAIETYLEKELA